MGRRRLGRETAFKALYRIDLMGKGIEDALADVGEDRGRDTEALGFARDLLETIGAHRPEVDERLRLAAPNWELDRMGSSIAPFCVWGSPRFFTGNGFPIESASTSTSRSRKNMVRKDRVDS